VGSGEIVTVVGANGAGKTTLLRCLSGVQPVSAGQITFRGEVLSKVPAYRRIQRGLAQSPEGRQIFTNLTVEENLRLGAYIYDDERVARDMEDAFVMFPILREKRNLAAGGLSGGQQQMLAIARALMGNPRVLLMDEPSEGLAPLIVTEVGRTIAQLKAAGQSIVLVEQNLKLALDLADDVVMLNTGRVVFAGGVDEVRGNEGLLTQHLGVF
jgi:branched-chain amino acid transport system ATP-binding protein